MVRRLKEIRGFQFKGILVILGCFLMMAVILFAERAGIHYQEKKRQISYIDRDRIVTEKEVASSLKKSCLVLMDSSQEESIQAWTQFQQIFMDMRVGTEVVDLQKQTLPELEPYETVTVSYTHLVLFHSGTDRGRDHGRRRTGYGFTGSETEYAGLFRNVCPG